MGLCKCRTVTNLFCYEHRKNVCEKCLISDHERCIVKSYLQWLQDSDFESVCSLCRGALTEENVVRLSCLDLFHVNCLNQRCEALPLTTAPNGYACPTCSTPILPNDNAHNPVAERIRQTFVEANWAKRVHALQGSTPQVVANGMGALSETRSKQVTPTPPIASTTTLPKASSQTIVTIEPEVNGNTPLLNAKTKTPSKKRWWAGEMRDGDEDKYGTKSSSTTLSTGSLSQSQIKRLALIIIIGVLCVLLIAKTFMSNSNEESP